ncbi:MAG: PilZ domain-containing protein [Myxococcales bacterium]
MGAAPKFSAERQHTRIPCFAPAVVESGGEMVAGVCENISLGGAFFRGAPRPRTPFVQMVLCIPSLGPVEVEGEVRHACADGFGVRFTWLSPAAALGIRIFLGAFR